MKKIFFISALLIVAFVGKAQIATAALQTAANNSLAVLASTANMTLTTSTATSGGTVTAGAKSVLFTTSAGFAGTINGGTRAESIIYSVNAANYLKLPAIPYTVTSGTLTIDVIK